MRSLRTPGMLPVYITILHSHHDDGRGRQQRAVFEAFKHHTIMLGRQIKIQEKGSQKPLTHHRKEGLRSAEKDGKDEPSVRDQSWSPAIECSKCDGEWSRSSSWSRFRISCKHGCRGITHVRIGVRPNHARHGGGKNWCIKFPKSKNRTEPGPGFRMEH